MIYELDFPEFTRVRFLFQGHEQYLPVLAVIEGNFPGRVFVNDRDKPQTALVWAVGRWAYIEGDRDCREFTHSLAEFVRETVIPDSQRLKMNWFELYAANSQSWMRELESCLGDFGLSRHFESVFVWGEERYLNFRSGYTFPAGSVVKQVEEPILPTSTLEVSFVPENFKTRTSFCFNLMIEDRVVAQCRSNGFAVGTEFMIDVNTFEKDDRGRGYVTAAAVALLDHCLHNGLVPFWEATEDNAVSRRLAQKLGFLEKETYPVYAIEF